MAAVIVASAELNTLAQMGRTIFFSSAAKIKKEQNEVVAEAIERQEENEARAEAAELEVDELKSQLADYQQALDVQQTRAIQYTASAVMNSPPLIPLPGSYRAST